MYVYLYADTLSPIRKNTNIKLYRSSSLSSIESFDCSYLTPSENDTSVAINLNWFNVNLLYLFILSILASKSSC